MTQLPFVPVLPTPEQIKLFSNIVETYCSLKHVNYSVVYDNFQNLVSFMIVFLYENPDEQPSEFRVLWDYEVLRQFKLHSFLCLLFSHLQDDDLF